MSCALFSACPALDKKLPHRSLGAFPTAIERVCGLLSDRVALWIKRDDQAGALYGGNKVRKLEFLLADPRLAGDPREDRRQGDRLDPPPAGSPALLTLGGYGSHHVLATALYARRLGLSCGAVVYPQPATPHACATLRHSLAAGAQLFPSGGYLDVPWQVLRARRALAAPLVIPAGGSSPLGTLGWVSGGLEIAAQVAAGQAPAFDVVYVALGSGGTAAGLWLGLHGSAAALVAVRVVPALVANRFLTRLLARRTVALLAGLLRRSLPPGSGSSPAAADRPALRVDGRFLGPGYGHVTPAASAAVLRAAAAGLTLETTYTGKAMAALLADADAGLLDGKRVLFVHTYSSVGLPPLTAPVAGGLPPRLVRFCQGVPAEDE